MIAAFHPTLPAPITATCAGATPGAPDISTPLPPWGASRNLAPAWVAMRPAISLMGANNGSEPSARITVS